MAEREKESASASPKPKKGMLDDDEDIGKEFLSSWKSVSVTEDDGMDFSFETIGKGKKSAFNFDKLDDMDFNFDGDFGKLSSFKVDMPDIDFSCSPKKTAKTKKGSSEDSSVGKGGKKEGAFSFSFDFNDMDNFEFGASLDKEENTPKVDSTAKEVASMQLDNEGANIPLSGDSAFCVDDSKSLPIRKSLEDSETGYSDVSIVSKLSPSRNTSSASVPIGVKLPQNGETAPLEKRIDDTPEETDHQCTLVKKGLLRTDAINEDIIKTAGGIELQNEACYIDEAPDGNTGINQSISCKMVIEDMPIHDNIQSMDLPADSMNSLDNARRKSFDMGTHSDSMDDSKPGKGQLDTEDVPSPSILWKTQSATKFEKLGESSVKKHDLAMVNSSKEPVGVYSKFLQRLGDAGTQLDDEAGVNQVGTKIIGATKTNTANERREETSNKKGLESKPVNNADKIPGLRKQYAAENSLSISSGHKTAEPIANQVLLASSKEPVRVSSKFFQKLGDARTKLDDGARVNQVETKIISTSKTTSAIERREETSDKKGLETKLANNADMIPGIEMKGLFVAENSWSVSSGHKTGPTSTETSDTSGTQAVVGSKGRGICSEAIQSSKIRSLDRSKLQTTNARAARIHSSLSIKRAPGASVAQLASRPLVRTTSTETSKEVTQSQINPEAPSLHPGGKSEKDKQQTLNPSLKRKTYETPNSSMISYSPLKRLSESPVESRRFNQSSPKSAFGGYMREVSCKNSEDINSRNSLDKVSPQVEIPTVKSLFDYEFTASLEKDGNLEKAEAYAKELEDLCNMLKKKQDEAKELLVRAVVNNNQLLMLNHPMFEQKIFDVQKLAARLMATEF